MKSLRYVVPTLAALVLAAMLSGCGKDSTPTGVSPVDESAPAAPAQVSMSISPETGAPTLDWTPSTSASIKGYLVFRYMPSPDRDYSYALVAQTDANTTSYPLPSVTELTTAYYRVKSVNGSDTQSNWSAIALVILKPTGNGPDTGGGAPGGPKADTDN